MCRSFRFYNERFHLEHVNNEFHTSIEKITEKIPWNSRSFVNLVTFGNKWDLWDNQQKQEIYIFCNPKYCDILIIIFNEVNDGFLLLAHLCE